MNKTIQKPTDEALLPCPFCGEAPAIAFKNAPSNLIRCENNACDIQPSTANESKWHYAVETWNTRAADPLRAIIPPAVEAALIAGEACVVKWELLKELCRAASDNDFAIEPEDARLDKPKPETGHE